MIKVSHKGAPLFELQQYDLCSLYAHKGKTYRIVKYSRDLQAAEAEELTLNDNLKEVCNDSTLLCPLCGYDHKDSWELGDSDDEHVCDRCGAILSFERLVSVSYVSTLVVRPNLQEVV